MKITDVTFEEYRWPRPKPITNGKHTYTHAGLTLVKIETDAEIMGIGLSSGGPIVRTAVEHLETELIGEDSLNAERLWDKMWIPTLIGRRWLTTRAISGIDIALWDLRGKVAGMLVYKMLGGYRVA